MRVALGLLLRRPALAQRVTEVAAWRGLELPGAGLLAGVVEQLQAHPDLTTAALLERWRDDPEGRHLHRLLERDDPVPEEGVEAEFDDTVRRLDEQARDARLAALLAQAAEGGLDAAGKEELQRLLKARGPGTGGGSTLEG